MFAFVIGFYKRSTPLFERVNLLIDRHIGGNVAVEEVGGAEARDMSRAQSRSDRRVSDPPPQLGVLARSTQLVVLSEALDGEWHYDPAARVQCAEHLVLLERKVRDVKRKVHIRRVDDLLQRGVRDGR